MAYINHITQNNLVDNGIVGTDYLISGASELLTASYTNPTTNTSNIVNATVNFPNGWNWDTNKIYNVLFLNGVYNSYGMSYDTTNTLTLKINNKDVYVKRQTNQFLKANYEKLGCWKTYYGSNNIYNLTVISEKSIVSMYYDSSLDGFVLVGNPLLIQYGSDGEANDYSVGFEIYADGLIKQWGYQYVGQSSSLIIGRKINFQINLNVVINEKSIHNLNVFLKNNINTSDKFITSWMTNDISSHYINILYTKHNSTVTSNSLDGIKFLESDGGRDGFRVRYYLESY